jgi:hypothetical protein
MTVNKDFSKNYIRFLLLQFKKSRFSTNLMSVFEVDVLKFAIHYIISTQVVLSEKKLHFFSVSICLFAFC